MVVTLHLSELLTYQIKASATAKTTAFSAAGKEVWLRLPSFATWPPRHLPERTNASTSINKSYVLPLNAAFLLQLLRRREEEGC